MLIDISDVRTDYMAYFAEGMGICPGGPRWFVEDFLPGENSKRNSIAFTLKSLGLATASFEWSSNRVDKRRINLASSGNPFKITGI